MTGFEASLINNANTSYKVLQVNLNAVWTLARDIGRHMLSTEGRTDHAKIINIASLLSFQGRFLGFRSFKSAELGGDINVLIGGLTVPAYAAAKHGVVGMVSTWHGYTYANGHG